MKCVVVALALLLCSAQALKMENKPSKQDHQDREDMKLKRPMRSKMPKTAKAPWTPENDNGEALENGNSNANIMYTWAVDHNIGDYIDGCMYAGVTVTMLFECVANDFFAGDSYLNSEVCEQMDIYVYLGMLIASSIAETIVASDSDFVDWNEVGMPSSKLENAKAHLRLQNAPITEAMKKRYNPAAAMKGFTQGWLAQSGSLKAAQDSINNFGYCDSVLIDAFSTEMQISSYSDLWDTSASNLDNMLAVTQDLVANGMPSGGTCPGGEITCDSVGAYFMTAEHTEMKAQNDDFYRSFHAKTFKESNRKIRKQGIFHRRRPFL